MEARSGHAADVVEGSTSPLRWAQGSVAGREQGVAATERMEEFSQ